MCKMEVKYAAMTSFRNKACHATDYAFMRSPTLRPILHIALTFCMYQIDNIFDPLFSYKIRALTKRVAHLEVIIDRKEIA